MAGFKSKVAMSNSRFDYQLPKVELTVDEGRIYGSRYYTVHPGPFWAMDSGIWANMMQWNINNFGPSPKEGVWTPNARWYANNAKFWFRNEKDLSMFLLRWS